MKIKAKTAGVTFIVLMITGVVISILSGYWATEGSRVPVKYSEGAFAGENNPADIRGSYSLGDIEKAFDIPVASLAAAFGLTGEPSPGSIQIKLFEERYPVVDGREIGTDSMRYFVALYRGLPYLPEESTALPKSAISILRKEGHMTEEELAMAEERAISPENGLPFHLSEEKDEFVKEIKGKTMFSELYDWGITKEELEEILGMPAGKRTESVRDFCMNNGIEFSAVKEPLQDLLDKR